MQQAYSTGLSSSFGERTKDTAAPRTVLQQSSLHAGNARCLRLENFCH